MSIQKRSSRIFSLLLAMATILSSVSFASAAEVPSANADKPKYEISVSGAENIAAYKEAGIIRSCDASPSALRTVEARAAKPTSVWNLDTQGCRSTTYSMSTYIYSGYLYNSGSYSDIWHTFYPNQVQKMTVHCYKANGVEWGSGYTSDNTDEEFAYAIATSSSTNYYFTYGSTNGNYISGSMDIC